MKEKVLNMICKNCNRNIQIRVRFDTASLLNKYLKV